MKRNKPIRFDDKITDGQRSRITRDFLKRLTTQMAKNSVAYFDRYSKHEKEYSDYSLRYQERGLYSLLGASIHQLTPVHISEIPVYRKEYKKGYSGGRADFWILYRNCHILLEVKQTYLSLRSKSDASLKAQWGDLQQQVKDLGEQINDWSVNPIRIGLHVIFPYRTLTNNATVPDNNAAIESVLKLLPKEYLWAAHWKLPEKMRLIKWKDEKRNDKFEHSPSIHFLAHLEFDGSGNIA